MVVVDKVVQGGKGLGALPLVILRPSNDVSWGSFKRAFGKDKNIKTSLNYLLYSLLNDQLIKINWLSNISILVWSCLFPGSLKKLLSVVPWFPLGFCLIMFKFSSSAVKLVQTDIEWVVVFPYVLLIIQISQSSQYSACFSCPPKVKGYGPTHAARK